MPLYPKAPQVALEACVGTTDSTPDATAGHWQLRGAKSACGWPGQTQSRAWEARFSQLADYEEQRPR